MVSCKVIIGSLQGNVHGLGKDIVAQALRSAGFDVIDLGVNVSAEAFVESAIREKARVIAISVSVNETREYLKDVADLLMRKKLHDDVKTVCGGQAVSEEICMKYGADAYAKDAQDCVNKVKALLNL
jgi:methylmalonyl-CoA mutase cobalamin-binding domain/chain